MDKISELAAKLAPYLRQPRRMTLKTPIESTAWNVDTYSTVSTATEINLSSVFSGTPSKILEVLLKISAADSAAWGTSGLYFACGCSSARWAQNVVPAYGGSLPGRFFGWVPCDENGNIFYKISASGTLTMTMTVEVHGWCI